MGIRFSVITVCRNEEKTIRATMESVLNQKWQNLEYIIIDGASTDGTFGIVRQYAKGDGRIRCFSERDGGIFNAMNKGIGRAGGDFLLFLNAGDVLHGNDVLDKVADAAAGADIVIGDVAFQFETGLKKHTYAVGGELRENLARGQNVCHQVIFASKACLEGGFDEQFQSCADYDWLCRQVEAGKRIVKVDAIVTDFDVHGVTSQAQYQKQHWKEYFMIIEKYFPERKCRYSEEIKALFVRERRERFQYRFMNRWLLLKQRGVELSSFFLRQGLYSIAVYGIHFMGQRLYDELKGSRVDVKYAIDRRPDQNGWGIPVVRPDDMLEAVDAVVITPIFDFLEIKAGLEEKLDCPMISIEEVLFYGYEGFGGQA